MIRSNIDKENLLGLTLSEAEKRLGYWWMLESVRVNWPIGWYRFHRAPNKYIELKTDNNNVVTSVLWTRKNLL